MPFPPILQELRSNGLFPEVVCSLTTRKLIILIEKSMTILVLLMSNSSEIKLISAKRKR
jgi:hypothetical protein